MAIISGRELDDLLEKYRLDIGAIRDAVMKEEVVEVSPEIALVASGVAGRLYGR